jgi:hypothetical protein
MSPTLSPQPIHFAEAAAFVNANHRHHVAPTGHKFSIAINDGEKVRGVIICGRPVGRRLDDGWTLEVTRCCTDGVKNGASMLYAAAWRAARAMGYRRVVTYTLAAEPGTSLVAAGWKAIGSTPGKSWSCKSRPRVDKHPLGQKTLWEVTP